MGLGSTPALSFSCLLPLGDLRLDLAKLLLMESSNTRIAWHQMLCTIRFDFFIVVCSGGILAPSFLPHRISPVVAALLSYRIVIKYWIVCSICIAVFCCYIVIYVVACAALVVGSCTMTYVIFAAFVVGSWALLYNQLGFFLTQFESAPIFYF